MAEKLAIQKKYFRLIFFHIFFTLIKTGQISCTTLEVITGGYLHMAENLAINYDRMQNRRREGEELKEKTWELDTSTRNNLGNPTNQTRMLSDWVTSGYFF